MSEKEVKVKFSTLYILPRALKRVMYYAQAADGEVSGLGTIVKRDGKYIVDDVFLLEQESSGADTELNPEAISTLMVDMMKKNEDPSKLKFWWHSHVNMGVFWSGTDDACAETLSREFAFSLVVNKAGEKLCRLDIYNPIRITFNHIKLEEIVEQDEELKAVCEKEVKEKVKTPSYGYHHKGATGGYVHGGYRGDVDPYEEYYGGRRDWHGHGSEDFRGGKKNEESKVILPDEIVADIERFITIATAKAELGGAFAKETWVEYCFETLKDVIEKKYEPKSSCKAFATFDTNYTACGGACKVCKACAWWTGFLTKKQELIEAETNTVVYGVEDETTDVPETTLEANDIIA